MLNIHVAGQEILQIIWKPLPHYRVHGILPPAHGLTQSTPLNTYMVFYVHGSVHRESMSIIVQQDATIYSLLYSCKTYLHISGGTSTHHQEHM